ncbi:MAG: cytochrome c biogenesis protein ResB [bacterium]|nr:MAG: cytochrome c biogenesis protein ResB [bacterium]
MSSPRDITNRLGSLRLTVVLLLLLAAVSILGTFLPQRRTAAEYDELLGPTASRAVQVVSLSDAYHSPWYRFLLLALAVNMVSCMSTRVPAMLSSLRGEAARRREPVWEGEMEKETESRLVEVFRSRGFRESSRDGARLLSRGGWGYALTLAGHLSILVIMAFSALGSAMGFIGTQRVYVGDAVDTYFNWKTMSDTRLPYLLAAEDLVRIPHPIALRIGVREAASGRKVRLITTHVGDDFSVPGLPGRIEITGFETGEKRLEGFWVDDEGRRTAITPEEEIGTSGLVLVPVAFALYPERQVQARTSLVRDGRVLITEEIAVNHPMRFQGIDIFLTDYGTDPYGIPYVGYQIVRDPGRAGVWAGCVLFLLCITGALFVRHRCVVLVRQGDSVRIHLSTRGMRPAAVEEILEAVGYVSEGDRDGD